MKPDDNLAHLFPAFLERLQPVLAETSRRTGDTWYVAEGYRDPHRQEELFRIGRRGVKGEVPVTWKRFPTWHGAGLAADCMPKRKGYAAPASWWKIYHDLGVQHGLQNPALAKGDLGHLQLTDYTARNAALHWVRMGFPAVHPPPPAPGPGTIHVVCDGLPVFDADPYLDDQGHAHAWARPVCEALELAIHDVHIQGSDVRLNVTTEQGVTKTLQGTTRLVQGGVRAYVTLRDLPVLCTWDKATHSVVLQGAAG